MDMVHIDLIAKAVIALSVGAIIGQLLWDRKRLNVPGFWIFLISLILVSVGYLIQVLGLAGFFPNEQAEPIGYGFAAAGSGLGAGAFFRVRDRFQPPLRFWILQISLIGIFVGHLVKAMASSGF